jgi:hypothetical protein
VVVGPTVIGSLVIKAPDFFTLITSLTCYWSEKNLWIIPNPPYFAIPIAISASVTVSIGDDTIGMFNGVFFEKSV